jgi:nuclear pore complex protein Nup98-Nup96
VPRAKIKTSPSLQFSDLAKVVNINNQAGTYEHQAWQLLSILFDEDDQMPNGISNELLEEHRERYRKDKLSEFWESLVFQDADEHARQANTKEEQAIAYLSAHNIPDACNALLGGLDLRLATMVAQIGGDLSMRQDMAEQLEQWRRFDVISEMDEAVRALYELIAGNCAVSEGKFSDGRENKAKTFGIAEYFGLDWRRAFGLRLWYGTLANEPIELAVAQYADALRDGQEIVNPTPWFTDDQQRMSWADPNPEEREDILWGILKLYASSKMDLPANLEEVLAPENVSGHPLNARLSFQLFQFFKSRLEDKNELSSRKVPMPTVRYSEGDGQFFTSSTASTAGDEQARDPLVELGDKLTLTYAASLHTPEYWKTALYVYTHLSSPAMREHYIRSLLAQHAKRFTLEDHDETYRYLVDNLDIPSEWLHAAAALQAKTDGDDLRQTMHLIKAGELEEAHEVLCRSVGPASIISRDYDGLRELLGEFVPTPSSSPIDETASMSSRARARHPREPVPGWSRGGQIYFDYIHLLDLNNQQSGYRVNEDLNSEIRDLLSKLQQALEAVARDKLEGCGLEERVALTEIAGVVASLVAKNKVWLSTHCFEEALLTVSQHNELSRVLKLPLSEDLWLRHSCDLSLNYYRAVMATGK